MTGRVLQFDAAAHNVADALLPWFVNGTLEGDELVFVQRHIGQCGRCQREAEWLRQLHAACVAAEADPDASKASRHLRRELEKPRKVRSAVSLLHGLWNHIRLRSPWAIAAELGAIIAFAIWLLPAPDGPVLYRTLGSPNANASITGNLVVVFEPTTTEAELRRILRDAGARIVDGPTQANAYILDVPAQRKEQAMRALRAEQSAVLVEQLDPPSTK